MYSRIKQQNFFFTKKKVTWTIHEVMYLEMNSFLSDVSAQSDITVKVMDACVVFSDDKGELPWPDVTRELVWGSLTLFWLLTLSSIKSLSSPGFVIFSKLTSFSSVSILATVDIEGRSFTVSCVQRSPTFKNLQASSTSKSSVNEVSMMFAISPCSYRFHVCNMRSLRIMSGTMDYSIMQYEESKHRFTFEY